MENSIFLSVVIFVIINLIQTWLIFSLKSLIKGGVIIGALEAIELPLIIYLVFKGGTSVFLIVISFEIIQWLSIAYFSTYSKIK